MVRSGREASLLNEGLSTILLVRGRGEGGTGGRVGPAGRGASELFS